MCDTRLDERRANMRSMTDATAGTTWRPTIELAAISVHPAANLFPKLADDELAQLADDINVQGVRVPIVLFDGELLDGRNRVAAAISVGVDTIPVVESGGDTDPWTTVVALNVHRRHLTVGQRAALGARLEPWYAEDAKTRMLAGRSRGAETGAVRRSTRRLGRDVRRRMGTSLHDPANPERGSAALRRPSHSNSLAGHRADCHRATRASSPALHVTPRNRRHMFTPADGGLSFISSDWQSIELVLSAVASVDRVMLDALRDGRNLLSEVAATLSVEHDAAKNAWYGIAYGSGVRLSAAQIGAPVPVARKLRSGLLGAWPQFAVWRRQVIAAAAKTGTVTTLTGRAAPIITEKDRDPTTGELPEPPDVAETRAVNYTLQGTGADLLVDAVERRVG